ncbi:3-oxoacyl-ACP reductase [Paeniglutamicibacter gangotriensis]|uniref:Short-chain dehydrogenase/reductase SDR n=2 Tax=Paeniglutamicibacter gangotriensis TaxID=254787 RepID=M7MUC5_9MICC|nr:3-oxoacyl-ACP reductase [Paeniglutamicibacter gangotriensis]EMQ98540.1 short-chain dehydrogenase/reductase SDR [Paeniglutamicibacter gangotriensis Lz1y]KAA0975222.1 3-oxoacyl-ACP reductase [Paeniglutamicibacter gangotriensis]
MLIKDQIVLVTGAGRGLGSELARAFAREGARLVLNYRSSESTARDLVAEIGADRALALRADVADAGQVAALVATATEHFGTPITTVINNALPDFSFNGDARAKAEGIDYTQFGAQFTGVIGGALNTIQATIPGMKEAGFGNIVNIGTNLFQNPVVPYHDYTAAKAALLSLTRTFAADLGPENIRVNMISGGLLRTTDASAATPEEVFELIAGSTPLRRVTSPAEFADAALLFASPWSRAVTGQNLVVDGGLVMN